MTQYDDGSSLGAWTIGSGTITSDASKGSPAAPSYNLPSGSYMYRNISVTLSSYEVRMYSTGLCDFFFGCDATGKGQMARLDTRGGGSLSGLATTTSWTSWSSPTTGQLSSTSGAWHTFIVTITGSTATLTIDGTAVGSSYTLAQPLGTWVGCVGDGQNGGNYDHIAIAPDVVSVTPAGVLPDREALRPAYRRIVRAGTRTVYVSATGSDSAAGTSAAPYATIQHAIDTYTPGDRVLVGTGTWGYTQLYNIRNRADAWLSIEADIGARPVIDVTGATHASGDGIDIQLSTFVGLFGFEVRASQTQSNSDASAIGVFRASHHIVNWCHDLHDFPGGGVNHFFIGANVGLSLPEGGWDIVDASYNTIHACCKHSQYNTSGISFYGAVDYTKTTWDGKYGYRAVGNYIYDCQCLVAYTPGGFSEPTDGDGISNDSLNTANSLYPTIVPYTKWGLNESNLIVACGGRAIHTYNTINLDAPNNTAIGNLRTSSSYITNGVEMDAQFDTAPAGGANVNYTGSVIIPLNTPNTTDAVSSYTGSIICGGTQTVPSGCTDRRGVGAAYVVAAPNVAALVAGVTARQLAPVTPDRVTRPALKVRGRLPIGLGYRPGRGAWAAGAFEPVPSQIVVLASS